jgi:hypothetical protein
MQELLKAIDAEKIAADAAMQANVNSGFIQPWLKYQFSCHKIAQFT